LEGGLITVGFTFNALGVTLVTFVPEIVTEKVMLTPTQTSEVKEGEIVWELTEKTKTRNSIETKVIFLMIYIYSFFSK
jgi:hypothetical protein